MKPEHLIRSYFAALSNKNWDQLGSLVTDDVTYYLRGPSVHSEFVEGREAFIRMSIETFQNFKDARFEVLGVTALDGALRMWRGRYIGSWRGLDGRVNESEGATIFEVWEGRISRVGVQLDEKELQKIDQSISERV